MKTLYDCVSEGIGHMQTRLGQGSSGVAYDLGNGYVQKTLRLDVGPNKSIRRLEKGIIDKWAKAKDLKVITPIEKWDGQSYNIVKLDCPCKEGDIISRCINKYLFSANPDDWDKNRVERMKKEVPEAEFVIQWCRDFIEDVSNIVGKNNVSRISDDLRSDNIGKDKNGEIKCFDWFDPWCSNIKL